jgi:aminocarboxymuconate-semialdehyde decarboxylase
VHDTRGAFANTARLPEAQTAAVRSGNARRIFKLQDASD